MSVSTAIIAALARRAVRAIRFTLSVVWFYLFRRKFGRSTDQRQHWEGRREDDLAGLAAVDAMPYYQGCDAVMVEWLRAMGGETLLEVGSHVGYRLSKFSARMPDHRFIGLDIGFENMVFGRERLPLGSNVSLVNATATQLPFAADGVDVIYTCVSLTHVSFEQIGKAMAELARVARFGVALWEVDCRPMAWRQRLRSINWSYAYMHAYEKLADDRLRLVEYRPMPDETGHPRYTLYRFEKVRS